jgi:hypothetical protein
MREDRVNALIIMILLWAACSFVFGVVELYIVMRIRFVTTVVEADLYWLFVFVGIAIFFVLRFIMKEGDYYPIRTFLRMIVFFCWFVIGCISAPFIITYSPFTLSEIKEYASLVKWFLYLTPILIFIVLSFFGIERRYRFMIMN